MEVSELSFRSGATLCDSLQQRAALLQPLAQALLTLPTVALTYRFAAPRLRPRFALQRPSKPPQSPFPGPPLSRASIWAFGAAREMAARRASASSLTGHDIDNPDNPFLDNPNIFSDHYAESIAESFADSVDARSVDYRSPADDALSSQSSSSSAAVAGLVPDAPQRPSLPSPWASSTLRSSLRKSMGSNTASASPDNTNNNTNATASRTAGTYVGSSPSSARRSPSDASTHSFARSQSPLSAANGPSHPYTMYPQSLGVSRSASVVTASTVRSPAPGRGPTHPYTLYPQNVAEDSSEEPSSILVGFPGHNSDFRQRMGPEGEIQDIIGPDGHSEQLPPYTRYPEESAAKVAAAQPLLPSIGEGSTESPSSPDHALLFPRRPHNFDESRPEPVEEMRRRGGHEQPSYAGSERMWKEMSWREKRQQKVLGVPLWLFLMIMLAITIFAAVSGGVIGGILGRHQATDESEEEKKYPSDVKQSPVAEVTVTTTMIDAAEVTVTPTSLAPLPTGFFKVDVGEQTSTSQNCLPQQDQRRAWSCSLNPDTFIFEVGFNKSTGLPYLSMETFFNSTVPQYGAQPPQAYGQTLKLASDMNNADWGLAYQFQILYDKLVVVDGSYLSSNPSNNKRGFDFSVPPPSYARKQVAREDQPWFCYWNQTLLEGFIYVENDTMAAAAEAAATAAFKSGTSLPSTPGYEAYSAATAENVSGAYPTPSSYDYTVSYMTPDQATPTSWAARARPYEARPSSSEPAPLAAVLHEHRARTASVEKCYPKRIKIEERRLWQQTPTSYCQRMFTDDMGVMRVLLDGNDNPVVIELTESDPQDQPSVIGQKRDALTPTEEKRALPSSGCYCQWQST
ncbi:hypothetical protein FH972_021650 [Carpinus fangiana]|uniref:DUF7820 domain-containing protein n=1 Tax=Carpinus fangiana TaxID=176857 RepID=A0A5N6KPZ1_9ROSI|nr:hypothetical protein FH972_021650 [Carpinus fangiana]